MGAFKKCVMCLTLLLAGLTLLAAGLAISPRSGFAQAEPADYVFPEVFGVKLGGDIRDYPGMEPSRPTTRFGTR